MKPFRSLLLIFALIINVVDVVGVVSLGTVFEVVGRTEEANLQLIDFIYVAEKEKEATETQRKQKPLGVWGSIHILPLFD